jgi:AcrR family transcriptional regulator
MSRWSPDARGRLEQAAFELFLDRGYDQTTVADIAARAGLTERTFFRYYADKREVLFGGTAALQNELLRALEELPPAIPAFEAVRIAVEAMCRFMRVTRAVARDRQQIISTHADLQERALIKRATLTATVQQALQKRGVETATASFAADMGMAAFHLGFGQWLDDPEGRDLADVVHAGFDQMRAVASAT